MTTKLEQLREALRGWPTNWKALMVDHDLEPVDAASGDEFMWSGDWEGLDRDSGVVRFGSDDDCGPQLGRDIADVVNAAPQLLALWEACEVERAAVCWSRAPGEAGPCVCSRGVVVGCPKTAARAAAKEVAQLQHEARDHRDIIKSAQAEVDRLKREVYRLRGEIARMQPVVEACVLVAELDELCDEHPAVEDPIGNDAEQRMFGAVKARTDAVHAYRSRKP